MSRLKRSFVLLAFYLGIIFNIEKLPLGGQSPLQLHSFVDLLIVLAIIAIIVIPRLQRSLLHIQLGLWTIGYFGFWFLGELSGGRITMEPQTMLIEIIFLLIAVALAHDLARELHETEDTLDKLVYSTFRGRTMKLDDATDEIKDELTRSRRYQRPLTVMVIEPEPASLEDNIQHTFKEIQLNLARRYAMARISEIINHEARRTDIIIKQDHPERFILLCPETDPGNTNTLLRRVQDSVQDTLGVSMAWGMATFPDDGLTFEGLVHRANSKLLKASGYSLPGSKE